MLFTAILSLRVGPVYQSTVWILKIYFNNWQAHHSSCNIFSFMYSLQFLVPEQVIDVGIRCKVVWTGFMLVS